MCHTLTYDAPPNSLMDSNESSKVKTTKEGVGAHSLTHSISGVKGRARALRSGLERLRSNTIIHTDLH